MSLEQERGEYQGGNEPKHVIAQDLDPVGHFRTIMGIVNYRLHYGYVFDGLELIAEHFIDAFDLWVKKIGKLDLPYDKKSEFKIPKELPQDLVKEFKQLWYGKTYYFAIHDIKGNITSDKVLYRKPAWLLEDETLVEMPALLHLNPKSALKNDSDPRVLIQEPIDFDVAWEGYEASQLSTIVKFIMEDSDGVHAIFESDEDIMSSEALTMEISREAYAKLVRLLKIEILKRKTRLWDLAMDILSTYRYAINMRRAMIEFGDFDGVRRE